MTHDELLAKIDYWFDTDNFHLQKNALRAVVELHKPIMGQIILVIVQNVSIDTQEGFTPAKPFRLLRRNSISYGSAMWR
jgi:hypothetical protein